MRNAVCGLALVVAAGCSVLAPQRDVSRFYTLSPRAGLGAGEARHSGGLTVVLGPVTLPAYLDRNEIAVRVSPSELTYAPSERWAEPLAENLARVLAEDLGAALGSDRVLLAPSSAGVTPDFWIEVIVVRFESNAEGEVQLTARWALRDASRKLVRIRQSPYRRQATSATTEGRVAALSAALGDLADEMAAVLRELEKE